MNALDFLKAHHHLVEKTFARLDSTAGRQDPRLMERLADALATHTQLEQRLHAEVAFKTGDERMTELHGELHGASAGIACVVAELLGYGRYDETFASRLAVLRDVVRRHIRNDELEFFPMVRRLFPDGELETLGQELEAELIRIYGRGRPRRLFEKMDTLVVERVDGERTGDSRTSVFQ